MNLIPGINSCTIIDSSFNASPRALEAALKTLGDHPSERKIALLGSMNELGDASESAHRAIGQIAPRYAQVLITVGTEARWIAEEARAHGMPGRLTQSFDTAEEAALYLKDIVRRGDVLLVKGSRHGIRLERAVRILMKDPEQADQMLV